MDRPTNLMVVNAVLWFDDPLDWPRVREQLRQRLVAEFPRFRQRVVESSLPLDGPWWEDDPGFDMDAHVHHRLLPALGDQGALQQFVAEDDGDAARPRSTAVGGAPHRRLRPGLRDALPREPLHRRRHRPRTRHALADRRRRGAGIAPPQAARSGSGPLGRLSHSAGPHPDRTARSGRDGLARPAGGDGPSLGGDRSGRAGGRDAKTLAKLLLTGRDADTVLKGEPGVARRVAWSSPLRLDEVKAIGRAFDATVNDVLLTAVAGALRSYLERRENLVDELRAIVPFNLRPLDEPLPRKLGNRFGLVLLPLPVGIGARRERLAEVKRRMDVIKRSPEGAFSFGVLSAIGLTPRNCRT